MKAKVIATQEIIEIIMCDYNYALNEKVFLDVNKRNKRYFAHELEFVDEPEAEKKITPAENKTKREKEIDWEQRRYEIAKEMYPYAMKLIIEILADPYNTLQEKLLKKGMAKTQVAANLAVGYASILIKELKK